MQKEPQIIHRIIQILVESPRRRVDLAKLVGKTPRTITRYFDKIEELEYLLEKDSHGRYFIFGGEEFRNRRFSHYERQYIALAVSQMTDAAPVRQSILEKIDCPELPIPRSSSLKKQIAAQNLQEIKWAIDHHKTIILKNYFSPNGAKTQSDRKINPIAFANNHRQLLAYEIASRKEKTFNLDRIEKVVVTNQDFSERKAKALYADPFGFTHTQQYFVCLRLSPLAKQLMLEYHPNAAQYLFQEKGQWYYKGTVCDYRGIGRFVFGLPGEIFVETPEFLQFLEEKKKFFTF
ncbi:COG2378 Predicted transcriptional regulator [Spirosomataceae bacterium]|jgi:predicted DNA-binding transcriptional regulator YafY